MNHMFRAKTLLNEWKPVLYGFLLQLTTRCLKDHHYDDYYITIIRIW